MNYVAMPWSDALVCVAMLIAAVIGYGLFATGRWPWERDE